MASVISKLAAVSNFVGKTFAIWVILFAVLAYIFPDGFKFLGAYITYLLGIVMFGMGLTLKPGDFSEVFKRPFEVLVGILGQFVVMPLVAFALCKLLDLPGEIAVGVILVGCCPGGTSSNVMTFLSRGDVPLSVTITACTTILAPFVTPALVYLFAKQWVDIDPYNMMISIVKVVIVPIVGGIILNALFSKFISKVVVTLPLISSAAIIAIVCAVVALSQERIATTGLIIFVVVVLHNCIGYLCGYLIAKLLRMNLSKRKTLAIEVGMQNSGLGSALAVNFFDPVAAVPSAIFSVWHNISGGIISTIFVNLKEENNKQDK